jgi:hypothetical protein
MDASLAVKLEGALPGLVALAAMPNLEVTGGSLVFDGNIKQANLAPAKRQVRAMIKPPKAICHWWISPDAMAPVAWTGLELFSPAADSSLISRCRNSFSQVGPPMAAELRAIQETE